MSGRHIPPSSRSSRRRSLQVDVEQVAASAVSCLRSAFQHRSALQSAGAVHVTTRCLDCSHAPLRFQRRRGSCSEVAVRRRSNCSVATRAATPPRATLVDAAWSTRPLTTRTRPSVRPSLRPWTNTTLQQYLATTHPHRHNVTPLSTQHNNPTSNNVKPTDLDAVQHTTVQLCPSVD